MLSRFSTNLAKHPKESPISSTLLRDAKVPILSPAVSPAVLEKPVRRIRVVIVANEEDGMVDAIRRFAGTRAISGHDSAIVACKCVAARSQCHAQRLPSQGGLHLLYTFFSKQIIGISHDNHGIIDCDRGRSSLNLTFLRRLTLSISVWVIGRTGKAKTIFPCVASGVQNVAWRSIKYVKERVGQQKTKRGRLTLLQSRTSTTAQVVVIARNELLNR